MHKILVTSLRSEYDLITSASLITKLHQEYPHSEIHLLTYAKHEDVAKLVSHVSKIHTISKERISQLFGGALYHDGFAINIFTKDIEEVLETHWSLVVNFSNDNVSAYLISALNFSRVIGTTISLSGTPVTSGIYNEYLNTVSPVIARHSVNLSTLKRCMCSLPKKDFDGTCIVIQNDHYKIAAQNFEKIRNSKSGSDAKIIALSLATDHQDSQVDIHSLEMIIEELEESERFKPVLLLDNNPRQKEIVNILNHKFGNRIISISAEVEALPGILSNLDVVISAPNKHLYLADAMGVTTIEVTPEVSLQRTNLPGSFSIITGVDNSFYNEALYALNVHYSESLAVETLTTQSRIYQVQEDDIGAFYSQVQGPVNIHEELNYHIARVYSLELLGNDRNNETLIGIAKQCQQSDINSYVKDLRSQITECSKHLLSTLRNLRNIHSSKENRKNFVKNLDALINTAKHEILTNIPVLLFEAEVNNIETNDKEQCFKETEMLLYNLKNNFQRLSKILEYLTENTKTLPIGATRQDTV